MPGARGAARSALRTRAPQRTPLRSASASVADERATRRHGGSPPHVKPSPIGHWRPAPDRSAFRVFAPAHGELAVVLADTGERVALAPDALGHWDAEVAALPDGTRYWLEVDGRRVPDVASRLQPGGVHAASAIAAPERPARDGWRGVPIEDAIVYELHLGTFTPEGTFAAAATRLPHLAALGITVVELLPIAAFPGQRNWGYDGTHLFALHAGYGDYADLRRFIEAAHGHGIAVVLDVVYNHFGPEGNYAAALAPFTKDAPTPWGAAINLDDAWNHGIRAFFLENLRYWLEDAGFDGLRMDAVSAISDNMPTHLLRECTALAHAIGEREGRSVLMIAEHLRNDRNVTARAGFGFDTQWSDDLAHALVAYLTGERARHCVNFGGFDDVVRALDAGFVLDGSRFDAYRCFMTSTDPAPLRGTELLVHTQNHDQIGNRLHADRLIATHGRAKALLAMTAMFATAFVPMLFMGEEYGETAPFHFFEDFGDPALVDAVRRGRLREFGLGAAAEPPADPHAVATFEASKLRWASLESREGRDVFAYCRGLVALKREGALGPRDRACVQVVADAATRLVRIETPATLTLLNFADGSRATGRDGAPILRSIELEASGALPAFGAAIWRRV